MARVRNNQGHRSKILNVFMRPFLEQELTQEKEAFDQARETIKPLQDKTWQLAKILSVGFIHLKTWKWLITCKINLTT